MKNITEFIDYLLANYQVFVIYFLISVPLTVWLDNHVCNHDCTITKKEGKESMRKIKYKSVNSLAVCDDNITIMIKKKPKQRYRTIIRAFYKRRFQQRKKENE